MENTKKKNRGPGLSPKRQAIHEKWLKEQTAGDKLQATSTKAQALKKKGGSRPQALLYVFKPQAARIQARGTRLKVRSSLCKLQDIFSLIKFYGTRTEGFLQDESIARMFHMKRKLMRTEGRLFTF